MKEDLKKDKIKREWIQMPTRNINAKIQNMIVKRDEINSEIKSN